MTSKTRPKILPRRTRIMANVEDGTSVPADDGNLWASQSQGKITRRRVLAAGGLLGAAALGLGLYFGLKEDSKQSQRTIISGQADASSEGCFGDVRADRTMEAQWTDADMTPEVSKGGWVRRPSTVACVRACGH